MRVLLVLVATIASATVVVAQPSADFPPVVLSVEHQEQVKVGVGDTLPEMSLSNVDSTEAAQLGESFGNAGTVVVWFRELDRQTKTLLRDLSPDVIEPFAKRNVGLIVIAIGESPDVEAVRELGYAGPIWLDPKGEAFAAIGSDSLPRVLALDAQGRVVWFDIEYSQSTRRELAQTLKQLAPAE